VVTLTAVCTLALLRPAVGGWFVATTRGRTPRLYRYPHSTGSRAVTWLLGGGYQWSTAPITRRGPESKNGASSLAGALAFRKHFAEAHGSLFASMRPSRYWYFLVDLGASLVAGVVAAVPSMELGGTGNLSSGTCLGAGAAARWARERACGRECRPRVDWHYGEQRRGGRGGHAAACNVWADAGCVRGGRRSGVLMFGRRRNISTSSSAARVAPRLRSPAPQRRRITHHQSDALEVLVYNACRRQAPPYKPYYYYYYYYLVCCSPCFGFPAVKMWSKLS
jgi:hypothetical protein